MTIENIFVSIGVQFSGKPQVYYYFMARDWAEEEATALKTPGARVVIPNSLKDDGTVSLTIATVCEVCDHMKEGCNKPVVSLIPAEWIGYAATCLRENAAAEKATAA